MRGHGGPIRALAVSADGTTALSGSFDTSAIRWLLRHDVAEQVLRLHESEVNPVAILKDGRAVTAGADAIIGIWTPGKPVPDAVLRSHEGPIVALTTASPSRSMGLRWSAPAMTRQCGSGCCRNRPLQSSRKPTPLNAVATAPDGEVAADVADGHIYFLSRSGKRLGATEAEPVAIVALGISRDGARIAAAGVSGAVALIDRKTRNVLRILGRVGLAGRVPPRWPHLAHRRWQPDDPLVGCRNR